ncbi:MAG: nucleotidyltransferase family protein [Ilumatobacteraceae bacterium]
MSVPRPIDHTVVIVLAAGAGSRFGGPVHKLLTELDGAPIAERAIESAVRSGVGPVVVVAGAVDLGPVVDRVMTRLAHRPSSELGARPNDDARATPLVIDNPMWADGQATSLQVGIRTARELGATAVVVGLADMPFVDPDTWRRVAASAAPIAVATYGGQRRNPVRLAAEIWPDLPTTGDEGARSLLRRSPDRVEEVPCSGSPDDIDTQEDLASWQSRSSTSSPSISPSTRRGR